MERTTTAPDPAGPVPDPALLDAVRTRLARDSAAPTPAKVAAALRAERGVLGDAEVLSIVRLLRADLAGAGPLDPLLADPLITDILVNATSIGLYPDVDARLALDPQTLQPGMIVADVIPNPPRTRLVRDAEARGRRMGFGAAGDDPRGARGAVRAELLVGRGLSQHRRRLPRAGSRRRSRGRGGAVAGDQ